MPAVTSHAALLMAASLPRRTTAFSGLQKGKCLPVLSSNWLLRKALCLHQQSADCIVRQMKASHGTLSSAIHSTGCLQAVLRFLLLQGMRCNTPRIADLLGMMSKAIFLSRLVLQLFMAVPCLQGFQTAPSIARRTTGSVGHEHGRSPCRRRFRL